MQHTNSGGSQGKYVKKLNPKEKIFANSFLKQDLQ